MGVFQGGGIAGITNCYENIGKAQVALPIFFCYNNQQTCSDDKMRENGRKFVGIILAIPGNPVYNG